MEADSREHVRFVGGSTNTMFSPNVHVMLIQLNIAFGFAFFEFNTGQLNDCRNKFLYQLFTHFKTAGQTVLLLCNN